MRKNVALLLYGQPRFVSSGISLGSLKRFLSSEDVSVFGHVWFDKDIITYQTSTWSNLKSAPFDSSAIEIIKNIWPDINLEIQQPIHFELGDYAPRSSCFDDDENFMEPTLNELNASNTISQLYSISRVLEMANKANEKMKFDYYILTRYDIVINYFPKTSKWDSSKLLLTSPPHSFPDPILIGHPALVNQTNAFLDLSNYLVGVKGFLSPEEFKKAAFLSVYTENDFENVKSRVSFLRTNSKINGMFLLYVELGWLKQFFRRVAGKIEFETSKLKNK